MLQTKNPKAYVDTAALIAFLDRSDTHHHLFAQLFSDPPPLLATPLVIAEGQSWFLKRYDTTAALEFMNFIKELKALEVCPAGREMLHGVHQILRRFADQDLTFVDASGLWLMEKMKVRSCWSTDRHLGLTGVPLVIY